MKLPDNILSNLQNGRGMTPIALILMALASIGGILWGFAWWAPTAVSSGDQPVSQPAATPEVAPPVKKSIRLRPAQQPLRPCYECGMG